MNLIYLVAFGQEYMEQFNCIYPLLRQMGNDIMLITDKDVNYKRVRLYRVRTPKDRSQMFKYRIFGYKAADFRKYDAVCYMDTDIIMHQDIFEKYNDGIFAAAEPNVMMDNEHFSGMLTPIERSKAEDMPALNSGFIVVSRKFHSFWPYYERVTEAAYRRRPWIAEQHALNWIYFHDKFPVRLFDSQDIGWPVKGIPGKYAEHFICLKNEDKIKWMESRLA
jgi:hypothetical protein